MVYDGFIDIADAASVEARIRRMASGVEAGGVEADQAGARMSREVSRPPAA